MSEPALNKSITAFEREIGFKLFIRSTRCLRLTPEGEMLLPRARGILDTIDESFEECRALRRKLNGLLRVAHMAVDSDRAFLVALNEMSRLHGKEAVQIGEGMGSQYVGRIQSGDLDFAVTALMDVSSLPRSMDYRVLRDLRMSIVVADDHPYANRQFLELSDLGGESVIFTSSAPHEGNRYVFEEANRRGFSCDSIAVNSISSAIPLMRMHLGLMPKSDLWVPCEGFSAVPLRLDKTPKLVAFWKKESESELLEDFRKVYFKESNVQR